MNWVWPGYKERKRRSGGENHFKMADNTVRVIMDSKPTLKLLQNHVIPFVATKWYELGIQLFDEKRPYELKNIEDNYNDTKKRCLKMFELWLGTHDNSTWHQIIEALKSPGVELQTEAAELEEKLTELSIASQSSAPQATNEIVITESDHDHFNADLNFSTYEDVSLAFSALYCVLQNVVKCSGDFRNIRTACLICADKKLSKQIKETQDFNSLFELFAENKQYCNWVNIKFVELISTASGNSRLISLINNYKEVIFSKTLREVWNKIPVRKRRTKYYSKLRAKFEKNPEDVTVKELTMMCPKLMKNIAVLIAVVKEKSLKITWLTPTDAVYQAYMSALMIPQESRLDSYLQIGDWLVYHPLHVLQNLCKEHWLISPSTLLIGYYHSVLMRDINADSLMDKMCSNGLLAAHDQQLILAAGHSIHQRNWLLLEHVRHMEMQAMIKFCQFIKEISSQLGLQLAGALQSDVTVAIESQYAPVKTSLVLEDAPTIYNPLTIYNPPSSLHILFLDLLDQIKELLKMHDTGLLTETCQSLMASETHSINFFSDGCILKMSNYGSTASLLQYLSFLFTWSDHSILRALASSSNEAIQLLDEFDSFLDPFNTIVSYPICMFSLSMIPSEDSPYTLLAIRCDKELWQCSLQYVFNIRSIIVEMCDITQHCLQLLAIQNDPIIFYWNIPKCVVNPIGDNLSQCGEYLYSQGIVEIVAYPKKILFTGDDITMGSLAFMVEREMDIDVEDEKQASTDVLLDHANKKIVDLQSELSKRIQLEEQLQEAAKKAIEREEMLEKDTKMRLQKIKDKVSHCNMELEKNFKQIFPKREIEQIVKGDFEGRDLMLQVEYSLDCLQKSAEIFGQAQMEYTKPKKLQDVESDESKTKVADKNVDYLQSEKGKESKDNLVEGYDELRENIEIEKDNAAKAADRLNRCNLELEKKLKQIIPDYETQPMESHEEKDRMEYNLDHLEKLIKYFDKVQFGYNKQQQREVQLQEELHETNSKLDLKTKELKKAEEDVKTLSKKLREIKTSLLPVTSKTENVNYPVRYEQLGRGLYGEVHKVRYKSSSYAGKVIHDKVLSTVTKITDRSASEFQRIQNKLAIECSFAENLSDPNLERFFEVVLSSANGGPMILTELLTESLSEFVKHPKGNIYVNQEISLCRDMAEGIAYLHSQQLVHGNLHGNNVLISSDGRAKIADYLCPNVFSDIAVDSSSGYIAPDTFQNKTAPSKESNIFTLGVLFLQVITKHPPQPRTSDLEIQHDFSKVPNHPLIPLIRQCLEIKRPEITSVCFELAQLIKENDSPQRMAYKLLYTTEHKPLVPTLTSGRRQKLQHMSCESMPARMFWGYAVLSNETEVYVTGGNSHNGVYIENVYKFSMLLNQWDKLPSVGLEHCVPIILDKKLSLIGGRRPGNKIIVNTVTTYDDGWISKYPDMIQIRYRPAVVTFGDYVVVLGGRIKHRSTMTDSIEVMNIEERKWIKLATCLPKKMYDMQATVSRDYVWIVGYDDGSNRSNKVYSIAVRDLISNPELKHTFKTIRHDTLYYKMSVVPNSDPLVVLGGDNWRNRPTDAVIAFDPKTESWNEVASLSCPRAYSTVARVGECGLLIIGGCTETKSDRASNSTCLQTIELYYIE